MPRDSAGGAVKVPVSQRALVQRIRRALQAKGEDLRISRDHQLKLLGRYYVVGKNGVVAKNVSLVRMAEQLKLLEPWEAPPKD
jgi:hypothetical protein